jgi:hypothetical protein
MNFRNCADKMQSLKSSMKLFESPFLTTWALGSSDKGRQ